MQLQGACFCIGHPRTELFREPSWGKCFIFELSMFNFPKWTFKFYPIRFHDCINSLRNTRICVFFQKKPTLKGSINLSKIKCVEIVCCDVPIPCNYKYPFQVSLKVLKIRKCIKILNAYIHPQKNCA